MCAAGETAVGNKRHVVAEARTHDGSRGTEHLSHARAALGSFVTDHDHITFLDLAGEDGFHGFFLGIKRTRRAGKAQAFLAGDLSHGTFGG